MTEFDQLLDATIVHLEHLKEDGVSHLPISSTLLEQLQESPQPPRVVSKVSLETKKNEARPAEVLVPQAEAIPVQFENALSEEEKANALTHLRERADACVKCSNLARSRKNVVFGVGSVNADLMFVGEAPGMDEDVAGEPFVGKAGQLLTRIIETMGLNREVVYIGNVLKCRPDTPGRRYGNRKPTPQEMVTCRPFLMEQIRIVRPKVLVALGATAVEGLLGVSSVAITRYRGEFKDFGGIPLMPTYHPAYVLRNQSHRIKRQIWEDMLQVMTRLGMEISDKQQGYFSQS
ncbi:MAG: uracil-DNA glycosylase [Verrucomicrobia bacterium]|jgi:uracil-DNA glycosylase|nr:uracil-DNA glycosylase [Verrucomicrobiota bacterium]MDB4745661.1 uracil-DNA glycosylase [Verrucomicrobiota bacterium]